MSSDSPSMETNATPSGLAIRPRRIRFSLLSGRKRGEAAQRAETRGQAAVASVGEAGRSGTRPEALSGRKRGEAGAACT